MTPTLSPLAELLVDRGQTEPEDRADILWQALMVCHDCPHRMIDHNEVAFVCRLCSCNQSQRGLSARADDRLMELGRAIHDALISDTDR